MGKDRLRNSNKEEYKKRQKEKKKRTIKKAKQQQSRNYRGKIRREVKMYADSYRDLKDRHVLIVFKDTENMERILLQKHKFYNSTSLLLTLPVITEEMIENYLEVEENKDTSTSTEITLANDTTRISDMIKYFFGVESSDVTVDSKTPLLICRDCSLTEKKDDLFKINVRPYNVESWYSNAVVTTYMGYRVYKGERLKDFFYVKGEKLDNIYIFQDTILELALYKGLSNKVPMDYIISDTAILSKKDAPASQELSKLLRSLYRENRFINEKKENKELNSDDKSR